MIFYIFIYYYKMEDIYFKDDYELFSYAKKNKYQKKKLMLS